MLWRRGDKNKTRNLRGQMGPPAARPLTVICSLGGGPDQMEKGKGRAARYLAPAPPRPATPRHAPLQTALPSLFPCPALGQTTARWRAATLRTPPGVNDRGMKIGETGWKGGESSLCRVAT